eukprot:6205767-Pleurochrysis_carterae.AAC.3
MRVCGCSLAGQTRAGKAGLAQHGGERADGRKGKNTTNEWVQVGWAAACQVDVLGRLVGGVEADDVWVSQGAEHLELTHLRRIGVRARWEDEW